MLKTLTERFTYKFKLIFKVVLLTLLYFIVIITFAQESSTDLSVELKLGWQENFVQLSYPPQEVIPVVANLSRDSYVYLFKIEADDTVRLLYPWPFDENSDSHAVYPSAGLFFLYFMALGEIEGTERVIVISSLERLTQNDINQFNNPEAFKNPQFSTSYWTMAETNLKVSKAARLEDSVKKSSPYYIYYEQYVLN